MGAGEGRVAPIPAPAPGRPTPPGRPASPGVGAGPDGRIEPSPGRDPILGPGNAVCGREVALGSEGRAGFGRCSDPTLGRWKFGTWGRAMPPMPPMPPPGIPVGRCCMFGMLGRAVGMLGRAIGIWGRGAAICGRLGGIDGRAAGMAGRAAPPPTRPIEGLPPPAPPPPPGRALATPVNSRTMITVDAHAADSRIGEISSRDEQGPTVYGRRRSLVRITWQAVEASGRSRA